MQKRKANALQMVNVISDVALNKKHHKLSISPWVKQTRTELFMTHICTVSGSKTILTKNNINPNKTNLVQWSAGVFQIADGYHILGPAVYLPVKINI